MLSAQVHDVIAHTAAALQTAQPKDADAVRQQPRLVRFSPAMHQDSTALKRMLMQSLYRHPQVVRTTETARQVVRELFEAYTGEPTQMPAEYAARGNRHRAAADYVAGMTDRFASREHHRLTGQRLFAVAERPDGPAAPTG
jgi:dGTPase